MTRRGFSGGLKIATRAFENTARNAVEWSVAIPKFALPCGTLWSELPNQRDTSKRVILVWFWI